jgi:hypothetical protein
MKGLVVMQGLEVRRSEICILTFNLKHDLYLVFVLIYSTITHKIIPNIYEEQKSILILHSNKLKNLKFYKLFHRITHINVKFAL